MRNNAKCIICKKRAKLFCIQRGQNTCRLHFDWKKYEKDGKPKPTKK